MDSLKALLAKKRKAADEEFGGRKQVKRLDIEQARIQQLRTEEQQELVAKVSRGSLSTLPSGTASVASISACRKQNVPSRELQTGVESSQGLTLVLGQTLKRPCRRMRS